MTTRLRTNFISGSTSDNPLAVAATAINSPQFASLPVVVAPDFAVVTLDPARINGAAEVVYVTAHAAGATVVTVLRAQEGTTARQHAQGERWAHGETAGDFWGGGSEWYGSQLIGGELSFDGLGNLLTINQAIMDTDSGGWAHGLLSGIGVSRTVLVDGFITLTLNVSTGAATLDANSNPARSIPVTALQLYTAMATFAPNAVPRTVRVQLSWFNAANALLSTSTATAVESTTANTLVILTDTAPAGAVAATMNVAALAANETHYVSKMGVYLGTVTSFRLPGRAIAIQSITRPDAQYVDAVPFSHDSTGYGDLELRVTRYSDTFWSKAFWTIRRARGTFAAPTAPAAGDYIGGLRSYAWTSNGWTGAGDIYAMVDTVAAGQASGRIVIGANNLANANSVWLTLYGGTGVAVLSGSQMSLRTAASATDRIVLDPGNSRMATYGDQSGLIGYDLAGNVRYLIGLRSDVNGNVTDISLYSYGGSWQVNGAPYLRVNGGYLAAIGSGGIPRLYLKATDSAADAKVWDIVPSGNTFLFRAINDAENASDTWLTVTRSGYAITNVQIKPPGIGYPSYVNGWTDYDGNTTWRQARFFIDAQQFVHMEGLIRNPTVTQTGLIFTLPVGYRPGKSVLFVVQCQTGTARVDIGSDGSVSLQGYNAGNGTYVTLSGITFSLQ